MELYEQLGYTEATLETVRLRLDKHKQNAYLNMEAQGLKHTANNILALSDIIHKIDSGESVDTTFNLMDMRKNAQLSKENEKESCIARLTWLIRAISNL